MKRLAAPLLLLLLEAATADTGSGDGRPQQQPAVEYYVQVAAGRPYTGLLRSGVDGEGTFGFGSVNAFAFNVTEGASPCSRLIGSVRGFTLQTSYGAETRSVALEVEVVYFDDGSGGVNATVSLQGLVLPSETNEIAIVGGSGAFYSARGIALISRISPSLYHHALFFSLG